ncbi:MAG TPA: hypothetical protein VMG12_00265 [Polyangiaceae bacterium]|nr:hypothetical protein [Polyangiaceae bacterium]
MNALESGCLTVAAALAGTCAAAGTALAETPPTPVAPPALAITSAAVAPLLEPPPPPAPDAPTTDIRQLLSEPAESCAAPCVTLEKGPITDELLREITEELPVIETVMIPVTRGVTIEAEDGSPAITLAVKPTKITRGSGIVAIKKF